MYFRTWSLKQTDECIFTWLITPGRDPSGFFITAAIGIAGSIVATYAGQAMGWYQPGQTAGFIGALVGSIILLVIYHLVRKKA